MPGYFGHPDFDAPEFHRCGPDGSAPKSRRLTREELRRLEEQLAEIERKARDERAERG